MGYLKYNGEEFEFDDRTATHLQIAIGAKLRRAEHFFLTWQLDHTRGSGRHSVWIDNGVSLHFFFSGSKTVTVNRVWLDQLMLTSSTPGGMQVGPEPLNKPTVAEDES
jgi:hypothetical protein